MYMCCERSMAPCDLSSASLTSSSVQFASSGKASLDFRGPDHRDVPHRLALRSGGNDTNIAADNPVERDPGKVRHSRFELVFVGCDQSDPFAFAEEPSGERGYHAYRQVHQIGRAHV